MSFTVGQKVEVVSSEEGFVGSYYEGTIVSCLDNGHYVVKYKTLRQAEDRRKALTETKPSNEIRPLPPCGRPQTLVLYPGQVIDVFDKDGWWVGKVTERLPDLIQWWQYEVHFEIYNAWIWYPIKKIRIHHDWVSGEWIRSPTIGPE